jgi:S1-C subfamily serine protease
MKKINLLVLMALCATAAGAQTAVWRESAAREHYEIVKQTSFAGVDVQDKSGQPVVREVFDAEKFPNDLKVGDVITGIEDITVTRSREWEAAMDRFRPDQKVTVHVLRDGKPLDISVKLRKVSVFGKVI